MMYDRLPYLKKKKKFHNIMMENPRSEKENIINDLRNLYRQEKLNQLKIKYLEILRTFLSIK